jgi:uncharacterized Zn-finger protein
VHCENTNEYVPINSPKVKWIDSSSVFINIEHAVIKECKNCETEYWANTIPGTEVAIQSIYVSSEGLELCKTCIPSYAASNYNPETNLVPDGSKIANCFGCSTTVLVGEKWSHIFPSPKIIGLDSDDNHDKSILVDNVTFCPQCSTRYNLCPTGHYASNWSNPITELPKQFYIQVSNPNTLDEVINTCLTHLCYSCMSEELKNIDDDSKLKIIDNPFSHIMLTKERYDKAVIEGIAFSSSCCTNLDDSLSPF